MSDCSPRHLPLEVALDDVLVVIDDETGESKVYYGASKMDLTMRWS